MEAPFVEQELIAQRYVVERQLGSGASGVVYLCRDSMIGGLQVALKMFPPSATENRTARARIQRELLAATNVDHPNVVKMYDSFQHGEYFGYSMEFVEGVSLQALLQRNGRFTLEHTVFLVSQICLGVSALHNHGLVHRDLKPANLMLPNENLIKIVDLGLVRNTNPLVRTSCGKVMTRDQNATEPLVTCGGEVVGTPLYLTPEYLVSGAFDERSDLYCIGLITYELLSGKAPFEGSPAHELLARKATQDPVPLSSVVPNIPQNVSAVIMRCLAQNPCRRFESVAEFKAALTEAAPWRISTPVPAEEQGRSLSVRTWRSLASFLTVSRILTWSFSVICIVAIFMMERRFFCARFRIGCRLVSPSFNYPQEIDAGYRLIRPRGSSLSKNDATKERVP